MGDRVAAIDPYVIPVGGSPKRRRGGRTTSWQSARGSDAVDGRSYRPGGGENKICRPTLGASVVAKYPHLHATGAGEDAYATMSGTSMAAGVVSGTVALMLEANRKLTPAQVKMALQSSATFVTTAGLLGAGAGSLNTAAAIGAALEGPVQQTTTIAGEIVQSSGTLTINTESEANTSAHEPV